MQSQESTKCEAGAKNGTNGFHSVTRPPIKILRPLFTFQLLILPAKKAKVVITIKAFYGLAFSSKFTMQRVIKNSISSSSIFALCFSFLDNERGSFR